MANYKCDTCGCVRDHPGEHHVMGCPGIFLKTRDPSPEPVCIKCHHLITDAGMYVDVDGQVSHVKCPLPAGDPAWTAQPPDSEGFWWLFGDEEFGTMGGNYSGAFPPEIEMRIVEVKKLGNSLIGAASGRMVPLTPFDKEKRKAGFIGVWQKAVPPEKPV
jgi:hypothetical protein